MTPSKSSKQSSPSDWSTDDSYSPDRFYTRSTDPKGHSSIAHVRILEEISEVISQLVQSKTIPEYKTAQDLIRDAIFHRLHYLRENNCLNGRTDDVLARTRALDELLREEQRTIEYEDMLKKTSSLIKTYQSHGKEGVERARQLLESARSGISDIKDPYWLKRYNAILDQFTGILNS